MSLCAFALCTAMQTTTPAIILPGIVDPRPLQSDVDFTQQGEAQPNFVPWAIYLVGVFITAAVNGAVNCASNTTCVQTWQKFYSWWTTSGNRRVVDSDPGNGVETMTFQVGQRDVDGDGDLEYVLYSNVEGEDRLYEVAQDQSELNTDIFDEARKQNAYLLAQGR